MGEERDVQAVDEEAASENAKSEGVEETDGTSAQAAADEKQQAGEGKPKPAGRNDLQGLIGCAPYVFMGLLFVFFRYRETFEARPFVWGGVGFVLLLATAFFVYKSWSKGKKLGAPAQVLLIIVIALLPALLVVEWKEQAIRIIFLLVVSLLPGLLFYLFVSARRTSLLNDHLTNLHRLGLLDPGPHEGPEDRKRRVSSYLQEFEAIYGNLPPEWISKFLDGKTRLLKPEDRERQGEVDAFVSIIATETMVPVMAATLLVVVGWLWVLPPWHIDETRASWELAAAQAAEIVKERRESASSGEEGGGEAIEAGVGEPAVQEGEESPPTDAETESGEVPADETSADAPAEGAAPQAEGAAADSEPSPADEGDGPVARRQRSSPVLLLALAGQGGQGGAQATQTQDAQARESPDGPATPAKPAWYKPWTWFGSGDDGEATELETADQEVGGTDPGAADEAASAARAEADDEVTSPEQQAAEAEESYLRYAAALLPVRTPYAFAFLGAYFFSLQLLFRRFVRRDLGANAYISFSIRIVLAWLGTWVVVSALANLAEFRPEDASVAFLLTGFTVGVFPSVVWHVLSTATRATLGKFFDVFRVALPLSRLDGLNVWYETRLIEEDIENIPNMANASIVELLLRTRIPPNRIIDWMDQAILYTHLGPEAKKDPQRPSLLLRQHGLYNATSLIAGYRKTRNDEDRKAFEGILPLSEAEARPRIRSLIDAMVVNPNLGLIQHWRCIGDEECPEPGNEEGGASQEPAAR